MEGGSHAITWFLHRTGYKSENIQQITAAYRGDPERGVLILNYWNNPSSHLILSIDWSEKPNKYVGHNLTSVDENGEPLVLNWGEEYNGFNKEWQAFEALIIQETLSEKAQAIKEAAHGAALISDSVILS